MEGSSTLGRLGLEGLLLFVYSNFIFLVDRFTTWREVEKFFAEFFSFRFDNMSRCHLLVASLFPYSCALLLRFVFHVYTLEYLLVYCASFTFVPHLDKLEKNQPSRNF